MAAYPKQGAAVDAPRRAGQAQDTELDEYIRASVKVKLIKALQAKAQESAHPALTSKPQIRVARDDAKAKPRMTQAQLLRRAYTERQ